MKVLVVIFALIYWAPSKILNAQEVEIDFHHAQKKANKEGKNILMVFSGSDWCKPCIQLKRDVFDTAIFEAYKEKHLIHLELDFPYKSNALSADQREHNEAMAERYNPKGMFPEVLLLTKDGEVLRSVPYKKGMSSEEFITKLKG